MLPTTKPATPWIIDFRLLGADEVGVAPQAAHKARELKTQHYRNSSADPINTRMAPKSTRTAASAKRNPAVRKIGAPVRSMNPKQIRARARRHQRIADAELEALYKPIEEWDAEELARGMPRNKAGNFGGSQKPGYISRAFHEKIVKQFTEVVRMEMREQTVEALVVMKKVMTDTRIDSRGRDVVPAGTKLAAAQFLLEHVVGKPTQRTETDISIKLQAILGSAMLNPPQNGGQPELTQGYIEAEVVEDDAEEGE